MDRFAALAMTESGGKPHPSSRQLVASRARLAIPGERRGETRLVYNSETVQQQNLGELREPGPVRRSLKSSLQAGNQLRRHRGGADEGGDGRDLGRGQNADGLRQLRAVLSDQQMPIGVERADIDAAVADAVENGARGHEVADHLAIEPGTLLRAEAEQVMAERVEAGMGMGDRPTGAP